MESYSFCSLSHETQCPPPPPPPPSLQPLSEGSGSTSGWDTEVHTGEETLALLFPLTTPRTAVKPASGSWLEGQFKGTKSTGQKPHRAQNQHGENQHGENQHRELAAQREKHKFTLFHFRASSQLLRNPPEAPLSAKCVALVKAPILE